MFVTKCDICKKEIKSQDQAVLADIGYHITSNSFCLKCGKPVLDFLKKKFPKNKKYNVTKT